MDEKANILIVDDNVDICKTLYFILKHKDYRVTTAYSGQEAIEKAKEDPFDIIYMDIKMPLMDGVETYRRIKKIRPEAVVMMMTAYAVEDLIQEALEEGAFGVIYKPLDIEKVIGIIEEAREEKSGALILVVDDDPGTCITFNNILVKRNYRVGVAHTGEEAIALAREKAYDIIFIDVKLPTINGLDTYLTIKEVNPQAVAIMMTAYSHEMSDIVDEAIKNSAFTCIHKPLDIDETLRLIEEIQMRKSSPQRRRDR